MIDRKTLNEFLSTKLIDRIISSQLVMREKRFTARLKPSEVFDEYKDVKTDATVIIQGAVDLAFVEDGKLVIVDYKTDRVKDITKLAGLYKKQLDLYKSAMEQSEELTVKECILCQYPPRRIHYRIKRKPSVNSADGLIIFSLYRLLLHQSFFDCGRILCDNG